MLDGVTGTDALTCFVPPAPDQARGTRDAHRRSRAVRDLDGRGDAAGALDVGCAPAGRRSRGGVRALTARDAGHRRRGGPSYPAEADAAGGEVAGPRVDEPGGRLPVPDGP